MEKRMRALVCGCGNMGKAIVWSSIQLGLDVIALDNRADATAMLPQNLFDFMHIKDFEDTKKAITLTKPSVVISSLPYHQNKELAFYCIEQGIPYCDLGGSVPVSEEINRKANSLINGNPAPVMTDLGLAPGWVNILAEHGCRQLHQDKIEEVKMMVGGLPKEPDNPPLNYSATWSVDGLINEYKDKCRILENGNTARVDGMDGLETVETNSLGELEAFYTSGGSAHTIESMREKGVKNCSYKTLRYKGHCDAIKFLIRKCELEGECLDKIFTKGCAAVAGGPGQTSDLVIIKVTIKARESSWQKELLIPQGQFFSGMQKATAFPIASVAKMMAQGKLTGDKEQHRDYYTQFPKTLSYKDIDYDEFNKNIEFLREGIKDSTYEVD
jgi:saccharopine dehydrogenase-like NADP-dependent oxidoreductase